MAFRRGICKYRRDANLPSAGSHTYDLPRNSPGPPEPFEVLPTLKDNFRQPPRVKLDPAARIPNPLARRGFKRALDEPSFFSNLKRLTRFAIVKTATTPTTNHAVERIAINRPLESDSCEQGRVWRDAFPTQIPCQFLPLVSGQTTSRGSRLSRRGNPSRCRALEVTYRIRPLHPPCSQPQLISASSLAVAQ